MKPEIAMALETMGIGLENVTPTLDLETALDVLGVKRNQKAVHLFDVESKEPGEEPFAGESGEGAAQ
jgi:hypothetical protein